MNSTINSITLLIKVLWHISNTKKKIEAIFVIIFSIFTSIIQYFNIIITAFTFSFITSVAYSGKDSIELDLIFLDKIQLNSNSFLTVIGIWILSAILTYSSIIFTTYFLYKISYSFGNIISIKTMNIAISSKKVWRSIKSLMEKGLRYTLIMIQT